MNLLRESMLAWLPRYWTARIMFGFACVAGNALAAEKPEDLTPEQRAQVTWQAGYLFHNMGDYERAIALFRASIAVRPTAEAHTFLGWSLSHQGRLKEAIAQCEIAIKLDPDFGNPYNDIGVYLLELDKPTEAIPWFEKAIAAQRYCCYHYAHANLGRMQLAQGKVEEARRSFERALKHDPQYLPALLGLELIKQGGFRGL